MSDNLTTSTLITSVIPWWHLWGPATCAAIIGAIPGIISLIIASKRKVKIKIKVTSIRLHNGPPTGADRVSLDLISDSKIPVVISEVGFKLSNGKDFIIYSDRNRAEWAYSSSRSGFNLNLQEWAGNMEIQPWSSKSLIFDKQKYFALLKAIKEQIQNQKLAIKYIYAKDRAFGYYKNTKIKNM
jgi:hypothetical protein